MKTLILDALKVIADTVQIGSISQGNEFSVKHAGRLIPFKTPSKSPSSNSWTRKYLKNQAEESSPGSGSQSVWKIPFFHTPIN